MSLLGPDNGRVKILQYALNNVAVSNHIVHLYNNNHTPATADTTANYTESVVSGYTASTATGSLWTVAAVAGLVSATFPSITFTFSGAETLYGYWIQNNSTVLWAELFSSAFTMPGGGGNIVLNLDITLSN